MNRLWTLFVLFLMGVPSWSCAPALSDRFADALSPWRSAGGPGGAVLVVDGDSVLLREGFGLADVESGIRNTSSTHFRLASVTKQFTALCILQLQESGALRLDQPISDFFPGFAPVGTSITVRHLLTHTSGLVAYEDVMSDTTTVPVLDADVLRLVEGIDSTSFAPGTHYRYSNTGFALLSLIVEKVTGMRFADYLRSKIFTPAGMAGSVAYERGRSTVTDRAYGYSPADSGGAGFLRTDQSSTSSVLGDGGIYASVDELLEWHRALLTTRLASSSTLKDALSPHAVSDDGSVKYGYGWMIGETHGLWTVYHSGSTIGFRNFLLRIPDRRMAVIVLMNRADGEAEKIARVLAEAVLSRRP